MARLLAFRGLTRDGAYRLLHHLVLAAGLAAMVAITVPELRAEAGAAIGATLWTCLGFFTAEWAARIARMLRDKRRPGDYLLSAGGLVDTLAVLPIPLALAAGMPADTAWVLGSLWVLKLTHFSPGLALLGRVVRLEAKPLASVLVIFLSILFLSATAIYVLEREGQPGSFGTLAASLWWAIVTLTTTGYGDMVPQTALGRLLAGIVMVSGVGVFALWAGILATGFAAESRRRDFLRAWDLVARVSFFRSLDSRAIADIARMLRHCELPEGTAVVRRGRAGDCMYFIVSGEVEVDVAPKPVRLREGQFFGEMALLGSGIRTATVTTTRPATLLILDLADFRHLAAHYPELARAVEAEAMRRAGALSASSQDREPVGDAASSGTRRTEPEARP